jgi:hypothetical protein
VIGASEISPAKIAAASAQIADKAIRRFTLLLSQSYQMTHAPTIAFRARPAQLIARNDELRRLYEAANEGRGIKAKLNEAHLVGR